MKAENNQIFTEVSSEEAVTINGGNYYINSIVAASGAWRYVPYAKRAVGNGQRLAYQRGGTTGQLNYLLGMANRLTRF
ncbi:MAG: hypothetical protein HC836_26890 [Richelia sp. RM2_1_2]|nr:hypothetical protein [Richelia sp. RM2_1_2]